MLAKILVHPNPEKITEEINNVLTTLEIKLNHPDLLVIDSDKLNLEQAKKVKEFFVLKPYQAKGRGVVINFVKETTVEAQNALLKTIEELPLHAWIIIGATSENIFLPTILSRCQIIKFKTDSQDLDEQTATEISHFTNLSIQERFAYIEKLKNKDEFLINLIKFFQTQLTKSKNLIETKAFLEQCLEAEKWAKSNVNIRGILEHLSLNIPKN